MTEFTFKSRMSVIAIKTSIFPIGWKLWYYIHVSSYISMVL